MILKSTFIFIVVMALQFFCCAPATATQCSKGHYSQRSGSYTCSKCGEYVFGWGDAERRTATVLAKHRREIPWEKAGKFLIPIAIALFPFAIFIWGMSLYNDGSVFWGLLVMAVGIISFIPWFKLVKEMINGDKDKERKEKIEENQNSQSEAGYENMFTCSGRVRRKKYGLRYLFPLLVVFSNLIFWIIAVVLGEISDASVLKMLEWLEWLAVVEIGMKIMLLFFCIPFLGATCRRLHDTGRSFWNVLIVFIPLAGPIILFVWLCQDSQPGANIYGENPKGIS